MDNYQMLEEIYASNKTVVYKGRKKQSIQYVSIKSVDKSRQKKIEQEVKLLYALNHINVLKFYTWYKTNNHIWLILEWCPGMNLLEVISTDLRIPEANTIVFLADLLAGLSYLHSNGILYCDLKPSNLLVNAASILKFYDFALAQRIVDVTPLGPLRQVHAGTPCYMAPELFIEGGVHSYASDLWALGCTLFELLTGRPPFVSESYSQLVKLILESPTPRISSSLASPVTIDFVQRLLIKDPAKRMTWGEILSHPLISFHVESPTLHLEPSFNSMIQSGVCSELPPGDDEELENEARQPLSPILQGHANPEVSPTIDKSTLVSSQPTSVAARKSTRLSTNPNLYPNTNGSSSPSSIEPSTPTSLKSKSKSRSRTRSSSRKRSSKKLRNSSTSNSTATIPEATLADITRRREAALSRRSQTDYIKVTPLSETTNDILLKSYDSTVGIDDSYVFIQGEDEAESQLDAKVDVDHDDGFENFDFVDSALISIPESGPAPSSLTPRKKSSSKTRPSTKTSATTATSKSIASKSTTKKTSTSKTRSTPRSSSRSTSRSTPRSTSSSASKTASRLSNSKNRSQLSSAPTTLKRKTSATKKTSPKLISKKTSTSSKTSSRSRSTSTSTSTSTSASRSKTPRTPRTPISSTSSRIPQLSARSRSSSKPSALSIKRPLSLRSSSTPRRPASSQSVTKSVTTSSSLSGFSAAHSAPLKIGEKTRKLLNVLRFHKSDSKPSPILSDRQDPPASSLVFQERTLRFKAHSRTSLASASDADWASFFLDVGGSLSGQLPINTKLNTLNYFLTLCKDTGFANRVVRSQLIPVFLTILASKSVRSPSFREKLLYGLGLLFRFATFIPAVEVEAAGIWNALSECLRATEVAVRIKATATTGELLFYIATEKKEESAPQWSPPNSLFSVLTIRGLRSTEDAAVRGNVILTISNICSIPNSFCSKFMTFDTVVALIQFYDETKNEEAREHAMTALSRIARLNPPLVHQIIEKKGLKWLSNGLKEQTSAVGILKVFLNLLNVALSSGSGVTRLQTALSTDPELLPLLMTNLERSYPILKAKTLLCFALLVSHDLHWLLSLYELNFFQIFDRLAKEKTGTYSNQCWQALQSVIIQAAPAIRDAISTELVRLGSKHRPSSRLPFSKSPWHYCPLLLHLVTSKIYRSKVVNQDLIVSHSQWFEKATSWSFLPLEFVACLKTMAEGISQSTTLLISNQSAIISDLLPTMCSGLARTAVDKKTKDAQAGGMKKRGGDGEEEEEEGEEGEGEKGELEDGDEESSGNLDERFFLLKIITDSLLFYFSRTDVYDPEARELSNNESASPETKTKTKTQTQTQALNQLVVRSLLPQYSKLLADEDPIPLYALKLLSHITDYNPAFVSVLIRFDLIPQLFEFFSLDHRNHNVHNMKLVSLVCSSPDIDRTLLYDYGLVGKLTSLLCYPLPPSCYPYLEHGLDILLSLLSHHYTLAFPTSASPSSTSSPSSPSAAKVPASTIKSLLLAHSPLLSIQPLCLNICAVDTAFESIGHTLRSIAAKSAQVLYFFVCLYPQESIDYIFSPSSRLTLMTALDHPHEGAVYLALLSMINQAISLSPDVALSVKSEPALCELIASLADILPATEVECSRLLQTLKAEEIATEQGLNPNDDLGGFGFSTSISGNTLAIGCVEAPGHVTIWNYDELALKWNFSELITGPSSVGNPAFGYTVLIYEPLGILLIADIDWGAPNGDSVGTVYFRELNPTTLKYEERTQIILPDINQYDLALGDCCGLFGRSLSVADDFFAISGIGINNGTVYTYQRQVTSGDWFFNTKINAPDPLVRNEPASFFGEEVSISKSAYYGESRYNILISAPGAYSNEGRVYLYYRTLGDGSEPWTYVREIQQDSSYLYGRYSSMNFDTFVNAGEARDDIHRIDIYTERGINTTPNTPWQSNKVTETDLDNEPRDAHIRASYFAISYGNRLAKTGYLDVYFRDFPTPGAWGFYEKLDFSDEANPPLEEASEQFGKSISLSERHLITNDFNHGTVLIYLLDSAETIAQGSAVTFAIIFLIITLIFMTITFVGFFVYRAIVYGKENEEERLLKIRSSFKLVVSQKISQKNANPALSAPLLVDATLRDGEGQDLKTSSKRGSRRQGGSNGSKRGSGNNSSSRRGSTGSRKSKKTVSSGSKRSKGSGRKKRRKIVLLNPLSPSYAKERKDKTFAKTLLVSPSQLNYEELKKRICIEFAVPQVDLAWIVDGVGQELTIRSEEDLEDIRELIEIQDVYLHVYPRKVNWLSLFSLFAALFDFATDVLYALFLYQSIATSSAFFYPFLVCISFITASIIVATLVVPAVIKGLIDSDDYFKNSFLTKFAGVGAVILVLALTNLDILSLLYSQLPIGGLNRIRMKERSKKLIIQAGWGSLILEDLPQFIIQLYVLIAVTPVFGTETISAVQVFSLIATTTMIFISIFKRILAQFIYKESQEEKDDKN